MLITVAIVISPREGMAMAVLCDRADHARERVFAHLSRRALADGRLRRHLPWAAVWLAVTIYAFRDRRAKSAEHLGEPGGVDVAPADDRRDALPIS